MIILHRNNKAGFTLIELLVVIAVMGVLATIVLVAVNPQAQFSKINDTQRKSDLRNIKQAVESYSVARGEYPRTPAGNWVYSTAANPWIPGLDNFMKEVPKDPINNIAGPWSTSGDYYTYAYRSNGLFFELVGRLENVADPDRCELKQYIRSGSPSCNAGSWCGTYSGDLIAMNNCGT